MNTTTEQYVDSVRAAAILRRRRIKVSPRRVLALAADGRFPGAQLYGRSWQIPVADLLVFRPRDTGRPKKIQSQQV